MKHNSKKPIPLAKRDTAELQRRIDEGLALTQQRLLARAAHDNLLLVVVRNGQLLELRASEVLREA